MAVYRYRWIILAVAWLAYIVMYMQRFAIPPLSPFIKEEFHLTSAQVGMLMGASALGYTSMQFPAGWFVDLIGVRWMLLIGEVSAGSLISLMFFTPSYSVSLVILLLAGLGCGCLLTATTKAIMLWFPVTERATAMGLKQTSSNLGGVVSALTLPTLALAVNWRCGFAIIGAIGIAAGIVSFVLYRDYPGEDYLTIKAPAGSINLIQDVFLNREVLLLAVICFLVVMVEYAAVTHLVLYLKNAMLFSVVLAGGFMAILEGAGAFGKPFFGVVSDVFFRGSRKKSYLLLTTICCILCLVIAFLPSDTSKWLVVLAIAIFGMTASGWSGVHLAFIGEFARKESIGLVTGFSMGVGIFGNVVGPPLFGYIVDISGSYRPAWLTLAIFNAAAIALLFLIREERRTL